MTKSFFTLLLSIFVTFSYADEGMWMLHLLKQQKLSEMQALGLKLDANDIYNPNGSSLKDAVVRFGGGCTGEIISSQGLLLTNHHCGFSQIQSHSSVENNYLDNGFWAMSHAEELPNPGLTVTFIEKMEDVTDFVKKSLEQDNRQSVDDNLFLSSKYLNGLAEKLAGVEYLAKNKEIEVEIVPFYEGNEYYMFTKKIYSDVRLVGAPPYSIGKYGADTDNYTWPRHSGDFALFRIYADKEGNPADYSENNVPLRPKRWLKVSTKGVKENDFTMVMGFPGSTNKFYTSWEVQERRDIDNEVRITMRDIRQRAMLEEMLADPKVNIQYASKYRKSTNAYKNAIGTNWAIDLRDFGLQKKEQQEKLLLWAKQNNKKEYVDALQTIEEIVKDRADLSYRRWMLNEGIRLGVEFSRVPVASANNLYEALNNNDVSGKKESLTGLKEDYEKFADKDYSPEVDKKVSKVMLKEYMENIQHEDLPVAFREINDKFDGDVDTYVDYLFENSIFGSDENMQRFISGNPSADALQNDPIFNFARSVRNEYAELNSALKSYDNKFNLARKTYLKGFIEMEGANFNFPDANRTLRLSYGQVKGYKPNDAVYYEHQTTLDGIMEKEDPDNWEFNVPEKLKQLYKEKDFGVYQTADGKIPVDFAATNHTTGGNSGSPVLNGKGELIGLNFDRNWEGVGGDIQFLPDYQRNISVDVRYILFIIDKYGGAKHLIDEMDLE